jgi:Right handed beta helix region
MSIFITKRRLVGLISASAVIGSMAVAALPGATFAASCTATGFVRDGIDLTAARMGGSVTGAVDATGCDIGVYNPTRVSNADIHGARYYGVVVNGKAVNTTNSKIHQIGEKPFDGTQHGRAILYLNGASGTISGNKVYAFQKNGIEVRGVNADGSTPGPRTSATVASNVITGQGPIDYIAQNGIVILGNATATVKDNTVSNFSYTPDGTEATGLLSDAVKVTVSGNKFVGTEVRIDGAVTANVLGGSTTTVGAHSVRVDLHSYAKPVAQATLGTKLDWRITVDGSTRLHVKQGFSERTVYYEHFKGRHTIRVFKNGQLVRRVVATF